MLIIEASQGARRRVAAVLRELGWDVIGVTDVRDGCAMFESQSPDAVLVGVLAPSDEGSLEALLRLANQSDVPLLNLGMSLRGTSDEIEAIVRTIEIGQN